MLERERKFLLKEGCESEFEGLEKEIIVQGYVMVMEDRYVRVRALFRKHNPVLVTINKVDYTLCVKVSGSSETDRCEVETKIDRDDFEELFDKCSRFIIKERISKVASHPKGVIRYSMDTYISHPHRPIYVEMEILRGDFPEVIPDFCGSEVTGLNEHSNIAFSSESSKEFRSAKEFMEDLRP